MRWAPGGGIPLTVDGEERVITEVNVRDGHWYSGDRRLSRSQQEELTRRSQAIIEEERRRYEERFPRRPPRVSIRECQEAIWMGGGIGMRLRGEERVIREVRTGGVGNPKQGRRMPCAAFSRGRVTRSTWDFGFRWPVNPDRGFNPPGSRKQRWRTTKR